MADQLPGAQWWEAAVNILSDGGNQGTGTLGAFPAVPDRGTVHDPPWLTNHHFKMDWSPADDQIWGPSWGPWRAGADYDKNIIDPNTESSAWQKFYGNAHTMLTGNVHLPGWTNTAQRPSFDGTGGLYDSLDAVKGWLDTNAPTVQGMRDSVAADEKTIQGQAADVIWQVLDHFHTGMTGVSSQLQGAMSYLRKAGGDLDNYRNALVTSWNQWIGGGAHTFTTQISGLNVSSSPYLISPIGCIQAVIAALTFSQNNHHWNLGLDISVPDNFVGTNDLASWSFWQDIETAAKAVWWANTALLDAAGITTAFNALAATYLTGPSKLQLTRPVFGALNLGNANDPNNPNTTDPNANLDQLINGLTNASGTNTPPPGTNAPGTNSANTNSANTNAPGTNSANTANLPGNQDTGGANFPTAVPNANGSGAPAGGTPGYLVPNPSGGYSFEPSSDFPAGTAVPAGAIPGSMVTGAGGARTFQPATPATSEEPAEYTPPKVVSSEPETYGTTVPAATVGSDGLPTGGAPAVDTAAPYTAPPSTSDASGAAGATGAAGASGQGNEVPLYPPMAGGMGMGGGMGGQQNTDRQRTTWLAEDEEVWGTEAAVAPAVLGRGTGRTTSKDEQEEYEYAPFGGTRPGTDGGRTRRGARPDRRRETGTGGSAGVGNV